MPHAWSIVTVAALISAGTALGQVDEKSSALPELIKHQASPPKPAVFSDKSYADAVAASKGTTKITVVKATAEWCGPCKMMNRTTFVDDKVVKWFADNGLVIEIDVDKDPKLAQDLNIAAMPTTIAYKDGKEFDRVVGYRGADQLIAWLEGVRAGRSAGDGMVATIQKTKDEGGKVPVKDRNDLARQLLQSGKLDQATDEYVWLWENMVKEEPAMVGVRNSFLVGEIRQLIARHPPAKDRFAAVRDGNWSAYASDHADVSSLSDWATLNNALDGGDKTLEWYDTAKNDPRQAAGVSRLSGALESLLASRNRVADICGLYPDPLEVVHRQETMNAAYLDKLGDTEQGKSIREASLRTFRSRAGLFYASLLLKSRDADAAKLLTEATRVDDSGAMRVALVQAALAQNVGHKGLLPLLDAAEKSGEEVQNLRTLLVQQAGKP